jgi:2-phospho-L-lactate transferase/gluconeogenesis factor (CofD/UPF0052 family)
MNDRGPVLALSGGVRGAKLALGLLHTLAPNALFVVANTGDDFEHLGLHVSPDVDTLLYALSDRDDRERGRGRRDETWHFMAALEELGGETWFRLGDRDLALHVPASVRTLLENADLRAVVICPSNPLISIDPILAVDGMRTALERCKAPVIAVSPLIGGHAIKGTTAKMLRDLGIEPSLSAIIEHYGNLIDGIVLDQADAANVEVFSGVRTMAVSTLMVTLDDRCHVATAALTLADRVGWSNA